jgi:hypothetical protein
MVNFDERGGTYDHVPPPAPPPDPQAAAGQLSFRFDRSGVRVPAIAISAWIPERTVVNDQYRNTSVIHTLREHWPLGQPFSAREATAANLDPVLSLPSKRRVTPTTGPTSTHGRSRPSTPRSTRPSSRSAVSPKRCSLPCSRSGRNSARPSQMSAPTPRSREPRASPRDVRPHVPQPEHRDLIRDP